ncbi:hypothetical protein MGG_15904 [Pyricularia oryzae 70-15]|uniref:Uncharacterized protein n=1 Tax=Pyricularia oryzae (strain 70-15 / ATCC MYA-4617 / FGSC 8958) TaxID=242507 RepID=G4MV12_PYRO7|nr:uncharacterized protein MGG_15904 [Pyricularia oryzae 70-15]EHA55746.1 hypothetical protein MGG_15904 [Pyricularia oryzae 70-15]
MQLMDEAQGPHHSISQTGCVSLSKLARVASVKRWTGISSRTASQMFPFWGFKKSRKQE